MKNTEEDGKKEKKEENGASLLWDTHHGTLVCTSLGLMLIYRARGRTCCTIDTFQGSKIRSASSRCVRKLIDVEEPRTLNLQ